MSYDTISAALAQRIAQASEADAARKAAPSPAATTRWLRALKAEVNASNTFLAATAGSVSVIETVGVALS